GRADRAAARARAAVGRARRDERRAAGAVLSRRGELDLLRREAPDDRQSGHRSRPGAVRSPRPAAGAFGPRFELSAHAAIPALPERRAARRAFDRASDGFSRACAVHDEIRTRLLERLDWMRLSPAVAVDVGCATGLAARALAARYPNARVLALDTSERMLRAARAERGEAPIEIVAGAAEALPLAPASVDVAVLNLSLP